MLKIGINPFTKKAKDELVGIDFSAGDLKIAYVKVSLAKRELADILSRKISGLPDEDVSRIIRDSFHDLGLKNPHVVNIIPTHLAISKNIEIPSIDRREIKEIISLQAGRHTPYSREEIISDYIDIGTYKNNYTKVLLVIASRSVIKRHYEIMDRAGFSLDEVFFVPEGLGHFVAKTLRLGNDDLPAIVHIDEHVTDFVVVFRGKLLFTRSIPIGASHILEEREKYEERLVEEVKKSLEAYHSEDIEKAPNLLILTGAIDELKALDLLLKDSSRLPLKIIPYFKNIPVSVKVMQNPSLAKRVSFLSVISPLFDFGAAEIDLVPEEIKLRKQIEERGKDLIKTGIFSLTVFILLVFIFISKIYFKSAQLKNLSAKYQSVDSEAKKLEKDFSRINLLRNYAASRGYSLEVLTELYALAPEDLVLSDISFYGQEKRASLKGTAGSMASVFSFVDKLEKSGYFKEVKTKYTTKRKEESRDVTDFEIAAVLEK